VAARREGGGVAVEVFNTGRGIPEEDLPHVFERIYRGPASTGHGLGLAIARETLLMNGGGMVMANTPDGVVFRVILPAGPSTSSS
jgi:signal transduction histidine kinase